MLGPKTYQKAYDRGRREHEETPSIYLNPYRLGSWRDAYAEGWLESKAGLPRKLFDYDEELNMCWTYA